MTSIQKAFSSLVVSAFAITTSFAQEAAAPAAAAPQAPGTFSMLVPFIAMFGVMYFLMIRPQQKKAREQAALLNNIQAGDEVVLSSGILGKVKSVEDKIMQLEVSNGVAIRVLKSQIVQKTTAGATVTGLTTDTSTKSKTNGNNTVSLNN